MPRPTSTARSSCSPSSAPPAPDPAAEGTDGDPDPRSVAWPLAAATAAVIAFCAVRAIVRGYTPLDDNAVTEARARDVFSARIPLIGTVSSVTQLGRETVNHPGPMLFDLLAVPVRVLPNGAGVAVGVAMLHVAVVAGLTWCSRRLIGDHGACIVVAVAAGLVWSLGSEAWYEVWQPVVPMLPFLLALVACWGLAAGHDEMMWIAVLATSFAAQTHGSYLVLAPAVLFGALIVRLLAHRRNPLSRRSVVVAAIVGAAVWVRPVLDQLFGRHNLAALLRRGAEGQDGAALGVVDGARAAAQVLVKPPLWLRPGVEASLPNSGGMVARDGHRLFDPPWLPFPIAAAGLLALACVLAVIARSAGRRGDRVMSAGAAVAAVAVGAGLVSLAGLPIDQFGFTAHKARWLWSIGAFLTIVVLVSVVRSAPTWPRRAGAASVLIGAAALAATLPTSWQLISAQQYMVASYEGARAVRRAATLLDARGTVYLDLSRRPFPDPYSDALAAALAADGVEFRVAGEYVVAQYGPGRELSPSDDIALTVRTFSGADYFAVPASWDVVADIADASPPVIVASREGLRLDGPNG